MNNLSNLIGTASYVDRGATSIFTHNVNDLNDTDLATVCGNHSVNGSPSFNSDYKITLAYASNITQIKINSTIQRAYQHTFTSDVSLYYGGAYHSIGSLTYGDNIDSVFDGSWSGVTIIKITSTGSTNTGTVPPNVSSIAIGEIYATGTFMADSNVKIKVTSRILDLGEELSLSSPVRYYRGGSKRSFLLVDTSSPLASPVRVRTTGGIKAIAEYTA